MSDALSRILDGLELSDLVRVWFPDLPAYKAPATIMCRSGAHELTPANRIWRQDRQGPGGCLACAIASSRRRAARREEREAR